jgi:hypothetical protein
MVIPRKATGCLAAAALMVGIASGTAEATAPLQFHDTFSDVFPCGGPEAPDFLMAYELDQIALVWPYDRSAKPTGRALVIATETYRVGEHALVVSYIDSSQNQTTVIEGDTLITTVYSSGTTTWTLDGTVLARSTGQVRLSYSVNDNGTPEDRSDDTDFEFVGMDTPGSGQNSSDGVDPCEVLAPFAN